ncbi:hypothetical protein DPMN_012783 [Dreissena polymorpha]|uniref:Uncharacterized protein n=1 Tax=Dreissena polymorpha TaxID=45954 RepID=A0A9D4N6G2_DREPO|nr:hypothetical protein DPMN_012783 [Dreissena polymorpha]
MDSESAIDIAHLLPCFLVVWENFGFRVVWEIFGSLVVREIFGCLVVWDIFGSRVVWEILVCVGDLCLEDLSS